MASQSQQLFEQALRVIPGGVNSPVRAFKAVGGTPLFMARGQGPYLWDEDGRRFIDYVGAWGPLVLGHAHPDVVHAVQSAAERGFGFGTPTRTEVEMAQLVCQLMPSIEKVRMVSSGTEATMSAIRLARGFTGRDKIVKFEGGYHGHPDSLLVKAGSGALTLGVPTSPGVPASLAAYTLTLEYNNSEAVRAAFAAQGKDIAAIIVEPVAGNMNCVPPVPGFLSTLREQCDRHGALLIFDEVMTGFRVGLGGAQALYGIRPDLTTLGKIIGGGLPVGAFGGRADIMDRITPDGPIFHAGTNSGNPIALAAGLATLRAIMKAGFYEDLSAKTRELIEGLAERAHAAKVPFSVQSVGGMFGLFFTGEKSITRFAQVTACDVPRFNRFFQAMLGEGIYLAPSAFEAGFVSSAHTAVDLADTFKAAEKAFASL